MSLTTVKRLPCEYGTDAIFKFLSVNRNYTALYWYERFLGFCHVGGVTDRVLIYREIMAWLPVPMATFTLISCPCSFTCSQRAFEISLLARAGCVVDILSWCSLCWAQSDSIIVRSVSLVLASRAVKFGCWKWVFLSLSVTVLQFMKLAV